MLISESKPTTNKLTCQEKNVNSDHVYVNSCQTSCLILEEMVNLLNGLNKPIPPDKVCKNFSCHHNIFWDKIFRHRGCHGQAGQLSINYDSEIAKEIRNCTRLLGGENLTFEEIGTIYNVVGRATIYRIVESALKKIRLRRQNL